MLGEFNEEEYGYRRILSILEEKHLKGTFFLNTFESYKHGSARIGEVARTISETNSTVEIHTHPYLKTGASKMLGDYNLEEQTSFIYEMKEFIKVYTGQTPVAHRSGSYSINNDTLFAIRTNNLFIDSSMFYGHPNCKVEWSKNKVVFKNDVIEIPITGFYRKYHTSKILQKNRVKMTFVKTDLNQCTLNELLMYIEKAKKLDIRIMNFFMHVYSLVLWDKQSFSRFLPNSKELIKFEHFLDVVRNDPKITVINTKDFLEMWREDKSQFIGSDKIPIISKNQSSRIVRLMNIWSRKKNKIS
jgi:hypothetical protein